MKDYNKAKTADARIDIRVPSQIKEEIVQEANRKPRQNLSITDSRQFKKVWCCTNFYSWHAQIRNNPG